MVFIEETEPRQLELTVPSFLLGPYAFGSLPSLPLALNAVRVGIFAHAVRPPEENGAVQGINGSVRFGVKLSNR